MQQKQEVYSNKKPTYIKKKNLNYNLKKQECKDNSNQSRIISKDLFNLKIYSLNKKQKKINIHLC